MSLGLSGNTRGIVLGDCFWQEEPVGPEAVWDLVKKAELISLPAGDKAQAYYVLFSASGWTEAAQAAAESLAAGTSKRAGGFPVAGVRLLNLEEIDADLVRWSV